MHGLGRQQLAVQFLFGRDKFPTQALEEMRQPATGDRQAAEFLQDPRGFREAQATAVPQGGGQGLGACPQMHPRAACRRGDLLRMGAGHRVAAAGAGRAPGRELEHPGAHRRKLLHILDARLRRAPRAAAVRTALRQAQGNLHPFIDLSRKGPAGSRMARPASGASGAAFFLLRRPAKGRHRRPVLRFEFSHALLERGHLRTERRISLLQLGDDLQQHWGALRQQLPQSLLFRAVPPQHPEV